MDILVKVKISKGTILMAGGDGGNTRAPRDMEGVINLKHMTMCRPFDEKSTRVYFTNGKSQLIQVKYENFIILLEKSYGENLIK